MRTKSTEIDLLSTLNPPPEKKRPVHPMDYILLGFILGALAMYAVVRIFPHAHCFAH